MCVSVCEGPLDLEQGRLYLHSEEFTRQAKVIPCYRYILPHTSALTGTGLDPADVCISICVCLMCVCAVCVRESEGICVLTSWQGGPEY